MKPNRKYLVILLSGLSLVYGCRNSYDLSQPVENELDKGKIILYPARMTEISTREKLLDLGNLLEASFIYEAISGTRQASFSNLSRNSFGASLGARELVTTSLTEEFSSSAENSNTTSNTNSSNTETTSGENLDGSYYSNTDSGSTGSENQSGYTNSESSNTANTQGYTDLPGTIFSYSPLASPSSTDNREVAFRELITAVANAQLGGNGLLRRLNLTPLASETHKLFMLPVDVHFTPGRHTETNYRGYAEMTIELPSGNEYNDLNIIAVAPMGYSHIISDFSSKVNEISANIFSGIGSSELLLEGKLEGLIQRLSELEAIVSQPEFAVNITSNNTVEFNYFGSKSLAGSSILKPQSFQVELFVIMEQDENIIEANKKIDSTNKNFGKKDITGPELLEKFENATFNTGVSEFVDPKQAPRFSYEWYYAPLKKLKKRKIGSEKEWSLSTYGEKISRNQHILMTRNVEDFNKISLTNVSVYKQEYDSTSENYYGFILLEGTELNIHEKIAKLFPALSLVDSNKILIKSTMKKTMEDWRLEDSSQGNQELKSYPVTAPSSFVFSVSNSKGEVIIESKVNSPDWIGDTFVSLGFGSKTKLVSGDKLHVILRVKELIKDKVGSNRDEDEDHERVLLFKTLTISGDKPNTKKKGISDLTTQITILEPGIVAIELNYIQKGFTAKSFEVNGKQITSFLQEKVTNLKDEDGKPYQKISKTLKLDLSTEDQKIEDVEKNKYYLVIKDDTDPTPKTLLSKLIEN